MIHYDMIPRTLVGDVYLAASSRGICAVMLGIRSRKRAEKKLEAMFPGETVKADRQRLERYRRQLEEYFAGTRTRFTVDLDLQAIRAPFHRKVLRKLRQLPHGRVISYGDLAERSGSPGAARAVGTAMAANPLPIVIPCHRVVASGGRLGGFSSGLAMKKKLLGREGVGLSRGGLLRASRGRGR